MENELFFRLEGSQYGEGVVLNEYNGVYSIVAAQESKDEEKVIYKRWCYPERDRKPIDTAIPMGVKLGDKQAMVSMLTSILQNITDTDFEDNQTNPETEKENAGEVPTHYKDIPF